MQENQQTVIVSPVQNPSFRESLSLWEKLSVLWQHKFLIIFFLVLGTLVGITLAFWERPQYTSDLLLQIDPKGNKAGKAMGEMGALLETASPADAEIRLIRSRMVLANVVEAEHMAISATPEDAKNRLLQKEGRMDLDMLQIPKMVRDDKWIAEVTGANTFDIYTPQGLKLVSGNVGEVVSVPFAGDTLKIQVKQMYATLGEKFVLSQQNPVTVLRNLSKNLVVREEGKQTGIISVSYTHRYADRAAAILNTIANTYLRQNVEMRSAEAEKTLTFLEEQLPAVKAKLDSAEKILATYRHEIGSVDMTGETKAHLEKEMDLQRQLMELEQQRQETVRLFKEEHPAVKTIVNRQNKLRGALASLRQRAETMPLKQQEVLRLQEDVEVNNVQYTTMLNNIQQLQVVRAGEVGNVRIVDYALVEPIPSEPNRINIIFLSVVAAFMLGVFLVFLINMKKNGVCSSIEVERETGISVLSKIPKSHSRFWRKRHHLNRHKPFVMQDPEDPASEAFNTLLTAIDFMTPEDEKKVMMVTGLIPGVGKSFVSMNLATLMALNGKKVLLIDGDMRRGVVDGGLNIGLAEVLAGRATLDTAVARHITDGLFVMSAGKTKSSACELLRTKAMSKLLEEARQKYDMVVVDTPPLSLVTDAELIAPLVDMTLFVLHYGLHSIDEIKESVDKLKNYTNKPSAFVMNHCEREPGHYYGYGYGYGYYRR